MESPKPSQMLIAKEISEALSESARLYNPISPWDEDKIPSSTFKSFS
jgi:hypothetical protein